jgi:hypothetical protein
MINDIARGVAVVAFGTFLLLPGPAGAQLGSGWTEYRPPETLQLRGCGAHSASGGVDEFRLTCATMSGDNRAEHRTMNDYSSGTNQFEGEMRVVSVGANIIVKQTFMPNVGPFLMMAVSADGRLYLHGGGGDVIPDVVGRWVRINTIHDVSAGTHQIYADGVLRTTKSGGRQVAWHDKYGSYRSQSGRGPAVVEWRNIKYFRGGRASGGANPPPPPPRDGGGSPDLRDATVASDGAIPDAAGTGGTAGSGGAGGTGGGTGGTGGSGGGMAGGASGGAAAGGSGGVGGSGGASGGATATGGTSGAAGASGRGGSPPAGSGGSGESGGGKAAPASGGCALGGPARAASAWTLAGLLLAVVARRRRRAAR